MRIFKKEKKYIFGLKKRALLGIIDILILNWLKKQPLCGQDITTKILANFNIDIGPGTMYPILYNLQNKGFIKPEAYYKKKMYFLTKKGKIVSIKARNDYFKIQKSILNLLK